MRYVPPAASVLPFGMLIALPLLPIPVICHPLMSTALDPILASSTHSSAVDRALPAQAISERTMFCDALAAWTGGRVGTRDSARRNPKTYFMVIG